MPTGDFYALCGFVLAITVQTGVIAGFIGKLSQKVEDLKSDFRDFKSDQGIMQANTTRNLQDVKNTVIACGGYKKAAGHAIGDC